MESSQDPGAFVCGKVKFVKELGNGCCDGLFTFVTNLSLCGGILSWIWESLTQVCKLANVVTVFARLVVI